MVNESKNLIEQLDGIIKQVLAHTKNIRTQAELLKNRQALKESLENLEGEYDKLIKKLEEGS